MLQGNRNWKGVQHGDWRGNKYQKAMSVAWITEKAVEMVRTMEEIMCTWKVIGGGEGERRKSDGSRIGEGRS